MTSVSSAFHKKQMIRSPGNWNRGNGHLVTGRGQSSRKPTRDGEVPTESWKQQGAVRAPQPESQGEGEAARQQLTRPVHGSPAGKEQGPSVSQLCLLPPASQPHSLLLCLFVGWSWRAGELLMESCRVKSTRRRLERGVRGAHG